MIRKFDYIKDFGIYKNFNWTTSGINEFNFKTIIYGWNYSGKTTLSRIFSSLRDKKLHSDYLHSNFKVISDVGSFDKTNLIDFPYDILVFNSDYIKTNLRLEFDYDTDIISFEVGENAIYQKKIDELQILIDGINGTEDTIGKRKKYSDIISEYDQFENYKFSDEAKKIKDESFISLINFTKANIKGIKNLIVSDLDSFIIKDKKELIRLSKIIKIEKPKDILNKVNLTLNHNLIKEVNFILNTIPQQSSIIKILDNDKDTYNWVKHGIVLNKKNTKCLFCDNMVTEERFTELNKYFENQASKLREKSTEILKSIELEETSINLINFPLSSNDFNEGYEDEYKRIKKIFDKNLVSYKNYLKKIKKQLNYKINSAIYSKVQSEQEFDFSKIDHQILKINDIILENNKFSENFSLIINNEREKFKNHLIAVFFKREKFIAKEKKAITAKIEIQKLDEKVDKALKEIARYNSMKESDEEGCLQYNYFVQSFLNRLDIEVKLDKETKKFNLLRENEKAKNLSEGEKTAIAFSHFLVTLKSIELKNKLLDYIIFIDDPISSLDGNHIFQINSLLKETFFKQDSSGKWEIKCKQIFISTHNFEFFTLLKELPTSRGYRYSNKESTNESRVFIERNLNESKILKLPNVYDSYSSEYHFLFGEIEKFNNATNKSTYDKLLVMPNILRRFIEMYTIAKYPSNDEVDERANKVFGKLQSKRILKPLHYFSHFNNIDRITKQSDLIADLPIACKTLIEIIKKDKDHYEALQKAISL